MAKVTVIGAGSWGLALATVLAENGHEVKVWSVLDSEIEMLNNFHEHKDKLPGVILSDLITYTNDVKEACCDKDLFIMAVPSTYVRSTAHLFAPYFEDGKIIVNVSKGIEDDTLSILTDVIKDEIPNCVEAVLSGPSHAEEVSRKIPTSVVVGANEKETAEYVQNIFMNDYFRVYVSPDILGMELCGALKNVVALAAGIADGLGYGDNTKAALITRGLSEITRLGVKMGGRPETFSGLTGIGDLIVTCASMHSRNRRAGILMGQGKTMQEAMDEVKMVVEGVYSAKAAIALSKKYEVEMPLVEIVNRILFDNMKATDAFTALMNRERKLEYADVNWNNK